MIYTITFNPAIDYTVHVKKISLGNTNRSGESYLQVGGKGVNCAIILKRLGIDNLRTGGFLGDKNNDLIFDILRNEDIYSNFILVDGAVRINVKIKSEQETEINALGPLVSNEKWDLFLEDVTKFNNDDLVIISGNLAYGMNLSHLKDFLKLLNEKEVKFTIDMDGANLLATLPYHPLLIKPNIVELEAISKPKQPLKTDEDVINAAIKLQEQGATNILVSLGAQGAIFISDNKDVYHVSANQGKLINSVGAGDSMLAAFIASYFVRQLPIEESLKIASASGSATSFTKFLATKEEIDKLTKSVKVSKLGDENGY